MMLTGDEIKLSCWFTSSGGDRERNRTIYWGEGVEVRVDTSMCVCVIITSQLSYDEVLMQYNYRVHLLSYWQGEMCYAFVSYFPKADGFDQCVQYADYDQCDNYINQSEISVLYFISISKKITREPVNVNCYIMLCLRLPV